MGIFSEKAAPSSELQWELYDSPEGPMSPWGPLQVLNWQRVEGEIEYEMDMRKPSTSLFHSKHFHITRGPSSNSEVAWTYKTMTKTLARADKKEEFVFNFKSKKDKELQTLSFRHGEEKYIWSASQYMGMIDGKLCDESIQSLHHQDGTFLAAFRLASPDGKADCKLNISPSCQSRLGDEYVLITLLIMLYEQWTNMQSDLKRSYLKNRLPSLERLRANLTPDRKLLYGYKSPEEVDKDILKINEKIVEAKARRSHGVDSSAGIAAVNAATSSVIASSC